MPNTRRTGFAETNTDASIKLLVKGQRVISTDGKRVWGTGENIIEASWQALVDGLEYGMNAASEKG